MLDTTLTKHNFGPTSCLPNNPCLFLETVIFLYGQYCLLCNKFHLLITIFALKNVLRWYCSGLGLLLLLIKYSRLAGVELVWWWLLCCISIIMPNTTLIEVEVELSL